MYIIYSIGLDTRSVTQRFIKEHKAAKMRGHISQGKR